MDRRYYSIQKNETVIYHTTHELNELISEDIIKTLNKIKEYCTINFTEPYKIQKIIEFIIALYKNDMFDSIEVWNKYLIKTLEEQCGNFKQLVDVEFLIETYKDYTLLTYHLNNVIL